MKFQDFKDKKVAFFVAETIPSFAGGGLNAFNFARFLVNQGAQAQILCLNYNNVLLKKQVVDKVQILRIAYYNLNILTKIVSLFGLVCSYIKLIKTNDILFIYGRYLPAYIIIILTGRIYKKNVIFRSSLLNDDDIIAIKKYSGIFWPLYKFAFRQISMYYAINKKFDEKWREIFSDTIPVLCTIQGVDTSVFSSTENKLNSLKKRNKVFSILSCGILIERKAYRYTFEALSHLEIDFKYTVIGQHLPDKYHRSSVSETCEMKSLYRLGNKLLGNKIEFINTVFNIKDYYTNADLFLHLAEEEGTPNVLLEAMAMGLPIITRPFEGLSDIIRQGENIEVLFPGKDLCNLINKLYNDPDYANNLGSMASSTIKKEFTFFHVARKITEKLDIE